LNDAREIRGRIIEIFEKASLPCRTIEEKRNLLHFVIVGAGPTGIEVPQFWRGFFVSLFVCLFSFFALSSFQSFVFYVRC
jgi:hypothetical protein